MFAMKRRVVPGLRVDAHDEPERGEQHEPEHHRGDQGERPLDRDAREDAASASSATPIASARRCRRREAEGHLPGCIGADSTSLM